MKINLANQSLSPIDYDVRQYPDGQQDIVLKPIKYNFLDSAVTDREPVTIYSRMNSWKDIELILCAVNALRRSGIENLHLEVPYILGARSDRQFVSYGTSYLVDVVAPVINSCNFKKVTCLDAHSDVAGACIKNLEVQGNYRVVANFFDAFKVNPQNCVIVSPDAGALKKIYSLLEDIDQNFNAQPELAIGMKHRDVKTGKILSTDVMLPKEKEGDMSARIPTYVIVDDICDGGRTFIELAKVLREKSYGCKVYLVVSHGIFSAGTDVLLEHLDGVFTTNSIRSTPDSARIKYQDVL